MTAAGGLASASGGNPSGSAASGGTGGQCGSGGGGVDPPTPMTTALPIRTMFNPHSGAGVVAVEFTPDSKFLITLGNETPQTIAIWDWTKDLETPDFTAQVRGDPQMLLRINPIDHTEIVTTGRQSVNFFTWDTESGIQQHIPIMSSKDFKHTPTAFTDSVFLPSAASEAISSTADGEIVVWTNRSLNNLSVKLEKGKKAAIKCMKLHNGSINVLMTFNKKYIITGGEDGFVKIFDMQIRLVLWFESLRAGPIISISFGPMSGSEKSDGTISETDIPDIIISTKKSRILLLTSSGTPTQGTGGVDADRNKPMEGPASMLPTVKVISEGQNDTIYGLAAHPCLPRFAVAGYSGGFGTSTDIGLIASVGSSAGLVQIWDYVTKQIVVSRQFEEPREEVPRGPGGKKPNKEVPAKVLEIQSLAFSQTGQTLGNIVTKMPGSGIIRIGFKNGQVRLVATDSLTDLPRSTPGPFQASSLPITRFVFSPTGSHLAVADSGFAVAIFKKEKVARTPGEAATSMKVEWVLVGRCKAHFREIV
ncbi:WD40-repeat-containing domain protein, partial [Blyttiomyces helicus]